jgi:hypothetical protein
MSAVLQSTGWDFLGRWHHGGRVRRLAVVFGNSPDFWLNVQRRNDLSAAMNSPRERERIERARPIGTAA